MKRSATPRSRKDPIEALEARILLAKQVIWIEGESPAQTTFVDYWLRAGTQTDKLSNGDWLMHSQGGTVYSRYNFTVPEAGTYQLWLRLQTYANPTNANYSYQIDTGSTVPLSMTDVAVGSPIDSGYTGASWSNRQIGWVYGGAVSLTAGSHQIRVNSTGSWGGIDAIGMTNYDWVPSGPVKPNPAVTPAATDWFPFTARPDDFSSSSAIDLSYLNEDTAGSKGYVTRVGDHYEFANQPGVPVKFWGIDASPVSDPVNITKQARWYAKHGVNIVRLAHFDSFFNPSRDASGNLSITAAKWDQFDRFFAALKDNGIYMDWSMVWKYPIHANDGYPSNLRTELVNGNNGESYGMVNFMTELQDIRWKFVSMMLNHVNPYTGLKYADDPALAIVEVQNEDNIFFWNPLNNMANATTNMPLHRDRLQLLWQQWVKAKYGTDTALRTAWGTGFRTTADQWGGVDGVNALDMKLYAGWELLGAGLPSWEANQQARAADFVRFLADTQRGYYERRIAQIRATGFRAVTVSTNWIVSENNPGGSSAHAPNLWADQAGDAIDKHDYWQGADGGWRIVTVDGPAPDAPTNGVPGEVRGSMLKSPGGGLLGVGMYQVEDKPFNYSEWNDTTPNWYQAEAAPMIAFYGMGLQGWDASFQFASGNYYFNSGYDSGGFLSFYNSDMPTYMGQFPALALAVRRGDITQGGTAAARRVNMTNAFSAKDAFTQSLPNNGWGGGTGSVDTSPEVLAIGRVSAKVGDGQAASQRETWTNYWNSTAKTINSDTGELFWDYNKGYFKVMSQKTQAVIGFAGPGTYDLPGFTVNITTDYVDLMFTALDNQPLSTSAKILVTALSRTKQYGSAFNADGTQITAIGADALMMQPVQATITLKNGLAHNVQVLDFYGVSTGQQVPLTGNTFTIDGRYASYYYQITRSPVSQPTVDLVASSDLGFSSTDNLTSDTTPTFSGIAIPSVTVELLSDGVTVASGTAAADGSYTLTASVLTNGPHSILARSYLNGQWISSTALSITIDTVAPTVSAAVNAGVAQRSMVTSVNVTFNEAVTLSGGAVQVLLSTGAAIPNTAVSITNPSNDQRSYVLTFSGSAVVGGSLADGIYDVVVSSSATRDLAGNALTANYTQRFHRLFGDANGDKRVNLVDYRSFRTTLGRSVGAPLFNAAFDFDANGLVNVIDLAKFRRRFGMRFSY